jgi:hypothetical protein
MADMEESMEEFRGSPAAGSRATTAGPDMAGFEALGRLSGDFVVSESETLRVSPGEVGE